LCSSGMLAHEAVRKKTVMVNRTHTFFIGHLGILVAFFAL
jgi:hypothetical protein